MVQLLNLIEAQLQTQQVAYVYSYYRMIAITKLFLNNYDTFTTLLISSDCEPRSL